MVELPAAVLSVDALAVSRGGPEPLLRGWRESQDPAVINWERVEELAPYGGIRIEDNVHVTETGCDNLTRKAFAEL